MDHLASPGVASYYLTTPIYYVNDAPHVGHAYTTLIADATARWHRLCGEDVFLLTGTDEHGLKVQQAAEANGVTPQEWADRTVERYKDAWRTLDITYDRFIRTTEPGHYAAVTKLLQACYDAGDIELDTYRGWYSVRTRSTSAPTTSRTTGPVVARSSSSRRRTTSSASAASRTGSCSGTRTIPTSSTRPAGATRSWG